MMLNLPENTVLLPIDMQQAFDEPGWPRRCNPACDANGHALLATWRKHGWPIIHVRHDSVEPNSTLRPGQPGHAFRDGFEPQSGEALVTKSVNSAFIGTDLDLRLRRLGASAVLTFGITTDMCVSTSVRMGANLGWEMFLAGDACACFDLHDDDGNVIPAEEVQRIHLATLGAEFAKIVKTAQVLEAIG